MGRGSTVRRGFQLAMAPELQTARHLHHREEGANAVLPYVDYR